MRDRIRDAALECFARRGFDGTSIADIERAAGFSVGSGSTYRYFSSKQELFEVVVKTALQQLPEALESIQEREPIAVMRAIHSSMQEASTLAAIALRDHDRFPELLGPVLDRVVDGPTNQLTDLLGSAGVAPASETAGLVIRALLAQTLLDGASGPQTTANRHGDPLESWLRLIGAGSSITDRSTDHPADSTAGVQPVAITLTPDSIATTDHRFVPATPTDDRVRVIAETLVADPGHSWSLDEWGIEVGASARTLRRLFQTETGLSFEGWRLRSRVDRAAQRLADGVPVSRVARELGYATVGGFVRAFRSATGTTPKAAVARGTRERPDSPGFWPDRPPDADQNLLTLFVQQALQGDDMNRRMAVAAMFTATLSLAAACGDDDATTSASDAATDVASSSASASELADEDVEVAASPLDGFREFSEPIPIFEVLEEREDTLLVRHGFGETEIPRNPQRIASDNGTLEIFLSLDMIPIVSQSEYFYGVEAAPAVAPLLEGIEIWERGVTNLEELALLEPDLIIGAEWMEWEADPEQMYERLSEIAPTILPLDDAESTWQSTTEFIAETFDRTDRLGELKAGFDAALVTQCERIRSVIGQGETLSHIEVYEDGWFFLVTAGWTNGDRYLPITTTSFAYTDCEILPGPENLEFAASDNTQLSLEIVGDIQADHLMLTVYPGGEGTLDDIESSALWATVPSVANNRVYDAPALIWSSYLSYPWALEQRANAIAG